MYFLTRLLFSAMVLLLVERVVPGVDIENVYVALIAAVVLGLLNTIVKPILVILTLPISIVTLGLFIFVINAGLFMFAASFIEGFAVEGFVPALLGSLIMSVGGVLASRYIKP